jgi:hypothetical protein
MIQYYCPYCKKWITDKDHIPDHHHNSETLDEKRAEHFRIIESEVYPGKEKKISEKAILNKEELLKMMTEGIGKNVKKKLKKLKNLKKKKAKNKPRRRKKQ